MFGKKKKEFKTEAELQRYIDLKINSTIYSNPASRNLDRLSRLQNTEINQLREKIIHLEKFLGVEFKTTSVTGYSKIKKSKKK